MKASSFHLITLKETPVDAEVVSHQLMLRAGMIHRLASGIYSWMPLGLKILRKVEKIVREEMNRAGALEVLMPAIQRTIKVLKRSWAGFRKTSKKSFATLAH